MLVVGLLFGLRIVCVMFAVGCCGVLLFILCLAGWVDFGVLVYWFLLVFVLLYD